MRTSGRLFIALNVEDIDDRDVQSAANDLIEVHQQVAALQNTFTPKAQAVQAEVTGALTEMVNAGVRLDGVIKKINEQTSALSDAVTRYCGSQQGSANEKFRESFLFIVSNSVANLKQVTEQLTQRADAVALVQKPAEPRLTHPMPDYSVGLAPQSLLTPPKQASARIGRVARALILATSETWDAMFKTGKELLGVLNQSEQLLKKNDELSQEMQRLLSAELVSQGGAPQKETDEFKPAAPAAPLPSPEPKTEAPAVEEPTEAEEPPAKEEPAEEGTTEEMEPMEAEDEEEEEIVEVIPKKEE